MTDQMIRDPSTGETVSPRPSNDDLDLASLPEKLDETTLLRVQAIANSPLPELPPCDSDTMSRVLLMMKATLPRQNADDVSGALFVAAYERQLGGYPADAIQWLCDKAIATCRWFPTIAECHEMIESWRRDDYDTRRRLDALRIAAKHRVARQLPAPDPIPPMTAESIAALPAPLVNIGLNKGWLKRDENGELVPA